jgi:hypothetical protein
MTMGYLLHEYGIYTTNMYVHMRVMHGVWVIFNALSCYVCNYSQKYKPQAMYWKLNIEMSCTRCMYVRARVCVCVCVFAST